MSGVRTINFYLPPEREPMLEHSNIAVKILSWWTYEETDYLQEYG